tara:strand:+ start:5996 stop:6871 length:876 start_codon:yes stop_codon:yes gene_type:complete
MSINLYSKKKLTRRKCRDLRYPKPTCYTRSQLLKVASDWNKNNSENKIKNYSRLRKNRLWKELSKRRGINESEWVTKNEKVNEDLNDRLAPKVPDEWAKNKNAWLSDIDLFNAMKAYVKQYSKYHFLWPAPIDFGDKTLSGKCAWSDLCNYSYSGLSKDYNYFGVIFNTDPHHLSGQHWISMFIDLKNGEICYYDSVGDEPPPEVKKLLNRLEKEGNEYLSSKKSKKKIQVKINKNRHQYKNTECGIYSLAFLHHMLSDGNFEKFTENGYPDEEIMKLRAHFFDDTDNIYT